MNTLILYKEDGEVYIFRYIVDQKMWSALIEKADELLDGNWESQ